MTLSTEDAAAAAAAITSLQTLLTTYDAPGHPAAKDTFAANNMLAPIAAARPLCLSLGQELLDEQTAAAHAAVAPFVVNAVEENRVVGEFGVLRALAGQLEGIRHNATEPGSARNNARLIVAIFQKVIAAAS